jgi:hypothetical protein
MRLHLSFVRRLFGLQAASASPSSLFRTSRSFGKNAMLTSQGATPSEFAVAVTVMIAAGIAVLVSDLLTVVIIIISVRYSRLTLIHYTKRQLSAHNK